MYFGAVGGLWSSDGTADGTGLVSEVGVFQWAATDSRPLTNVAGTLFFAGYDDVHGVEPWTSDGTGPGTRLIRDIRPDVEGSYPDEVEGLRGKVVFTTDPEPGRPALWESDHALAGTLLLRGLRARAHGLTRLRARLYFGAYDRTHGWELWMSDGTREGTGLFRDINKVPR
jgi:ELWxxDGT repeat protein